MEGYNNPGCGIKGTIWLKIGNLGDRDGIDTFESVQRHRWS